MKLLFENFGFIDKSDDKDDKQNKDYDFFFDAK
jgi:hypothetical protein